MTLLLRALARLVAFVLLLALALAGAGAVVLAITGGDPGVGSALRLPGLRDGAQGFLTSVEAGRERGWALLWGSLAALAGLLLLVGALRKAPSGEFLFEKGGDGRVGARRRALAQVVTAIAAQVRGVTGATARVAPRRRGPGGRIDVAVAHPLSADPKQVSRSVSEALKTLSDDSWAIRVRPRPERARKGARAE